jgi:ATP-binding cassette subfamily F protein uup
MRQPNFLILDEPTNDLDIVTLGILEEYLTEYKGCLILISHDRYFLDNIVDHLFVMQGNGVVKDFPGNYSDYRSWLDEQARQQAAEERQEAKQSAPQQKRQQLERKPKMTFKERQEFEALSKDIDLLTAEKAELEAAFNSGATMTDIAEKSARYTEVCEQLDEKEMRWLELSEKS